MRYTARMQNGTHDEPIRIAMWSGPRSLSTAMLRAWENRPDTVVVDEPFYACYLAGSGADHPLREEVLAAQSSDWDSIANSLTGPVDGEHRIFYQKHMTHHMLPGAPLAWMDRVSNAFLIRHPREVAASYARARARLPTPEELGYLRQQELFERVADREGAAPPVIDAADVLAKPARTLQALCDALGVPFDEHMLAWPAGPRATDGVWGSHWYASVWCSTGFGEPKPPSDPPPELEPLIETALPCYERLARYRLGAGAD